MNTAAVKSRPIIMSAGSVRAILDGRKTQTRRIVKPFKLTGKKMGEVTRVWSLPNDPCGFACRYVYGKPPRSEGYAESPIHCPYGVPGDLLWVRETWGTVRMHELGQHIFCGPRIPDRDQPVYKAGKQMGIPPKGELDCSSEGLAKWPVIWRDDHKPDRWRSSQRMPRKYARLWLRVVNVRVQGLQEVSDEDAIAEGLLTHSAVCNSGLAKYPDGVPEGVNADRNCDCSVRWFSRHWDTLNAKRGHPWSNNDWVWAITFEQAAATELFA